MTAGAGLRARLDAERDLLDVIRGAAGPVTMSITAGAAEVRVEVADGAGRRVGAGSTFAEAWAAARRGAGR